MYVRACNRRVCLYYQPHATAVRYGIVLLQLLIVLLSLLLLLLCDASQVGNASVIPSSMPQFRSLHSEVQAVFTHAKGDMALLCDAVAATAAAAEVSAYITQLTVAMQA
jgi:hypothetical protein